MFEKGLELVALILGLVISMTTVTLILKKAVIKDLTDHKKSYCGIHEGELKAIKATNRMMLECHDVTLQALDSIANGKTVNGEIVEQRRKLKEHMYDSMYK